MSAGDEFLDLASGGSGEGDLPPRGTARVESRIGGEQGSASGQYDRERLLDRGVDRARELIEGVRERAEEWGERAGHLGERAGSVASRAGGQLNSALRRAEDRLEEQSGVVSLVREYPLLSTGLAFTLGFLVAGESAASGRGFTGRALAQLRRAALAGVGTALMQELQELLDEHGGPAGLFAALTGSEEAREDL